MKRRSCEWCGDVAAKHYTKCIRCRNMPEYKKQLVQEFLLQTKRKQLRLEKEFQNYVRSLHE